MVKTKPGSITRNNDMRAHLHQGPSDANMSSLLSCYFQWLKHLGNEAA